ncbi:MAG: hypothetical protein M0P61_11990 [Ignavibacteriaceae bacterium]|jgi:hypothetical protein|nr:hypothetical protein [Ignavibacteriaceae bacterium]
MSTLPSPATKEFAASTIEKQVYTLTESLQEFLPIMNDRNRLGYALYKFMTGEGDEPLITVKSAKLKIIGISEVELAKKIEDGLKKVHKN